MLYRSITLAAILAFLPCVQTYAHSVDLIKEKIDRLLEQMNEEQNIIEDGMSMGSRRDALRDLRRIKRQQIPFVKQLEEVFLEKIENKNFQIIRAQAKVEQANEELANKNDLIREQFNLIEQLRAELDARPPRGRQYICSLTLFRRTYIGLSESEDVAKNQALLSCAEDYDLNLQCRRGSMNCSLN